MTVRLEIGSTRMIPCSARGAARVLQASCQSPVATHAVIDGASMTVTALVAMPDGSQSIRDTVSGRAADAQRLGEELADRLLESGAGELLAALGAADG